MKKPATSFFVVLPCLFVAATFSSVSAQDTKDPRNIAMTTLGKNMKAIARGLKAGSVTPEMIKQADAISQIADRLTDLFPKGQEKEDSRAKPEIWTDFAGFKKANQNFVVASAALVKAMASGDAIAAKAAQKRTGKTCGGCHKPYRLPKK